MSKKMFDEFLNMFRIAGEERVTPNTTPQRVEKEERKPNVKFSRDIETLQREGYSLQAGDTIELDLRSALKLLPRDRRRTDGYDSLVKYMRENYNVLLIIKSKKS